MRLSVVVPAYNEERLLGATLAAIRTAAACFDADGWELVVCDNNSTDRTAEIARAAGARVVFEPHNQIARARNRGAVAATGEWLVFIDADSTPSAALFADLREAIAGGRVIGGGCTLSADHDSLPVRAVMALWNGISRTMRWAAGAFVYCRRDVFEATGGFSQELYASEELELSGRLKRLARAQGLEFRILHRHPLRTSARKLHLYGWAEMLRVFGRFLRHPHRMLRSAKECSPWYDGRR